MGLYAWLLAVGLIAMALLAMLHALGATIRDFQRVQQLKAECARLRTAYAERLKEMQVMAETAPLPDRLVDGEFEFIESRKR